MNNSTNNARTIQKLSYPLNLLIMMMTVLLLASCGGTKVYNNDKTIVHRVQSTTFQPLNRLRPTTRAN